MASETRARAEEAVRKFGLAKRLKKKRPIDFSEASLNPLRAEQALEAGNRHLEAPPRLSGHSSMELVPRPNADERLTESQMQFLETLDDPNSINVASSEQRTDLATRAGVLPAAIDAAVSAQAEGPIEKMICHQLAAGHAAGMSLLIRLEDNPHLPPSEAVRLTNAAARLFEVYQGGALTLQKLKLAGTQRVVVQHHQQVNVEAGGQAVVAGRIRRGSRRKGRKAKNVR